MMIIFFAILALAIIFPLLSPGFILTLDTIMVPGGADIVQKLTLFLIFFLAGYGMARLCKNYFAGILYAINPFVYERVMAGHWDFLIGYALFPIIVLTMKNLLENPKLITTIVLAGLSTAAVYFAPHWAFILAVFLLVYFIVYFALNRGNLFPVVKYFLLFGGL
ncbi:MAG: hypothetical protein Q7S14_01360, partial [bacterium]|nr:hypothetical protein [bacterium]